MQSQDEIKFAQARFKIQEAICICFSTTELLLPIDLRALRAHVDSVVGPMQPDTVSGQQLVQSRTYARRNTNVTEKIDVAIGHTGPNWVPIVTVTSTSTDPEQVIFDGQFAEALQKVLFLITARIKPLA